MPEAMSNEFGGMSKGGDSRDPGVGEASCSSRPDCADPKSGNEAPSCDEESRGRSSPRHRRKRKS